MFFRGRIIAFLLMLMCAVTVNADIIINEIIQNPSAVLDDSGEWFEIYNSGLDDIDINGWIISDNGADSHVITTLGGLVIPAGGYLVLGNNADFDTNGGVIVDYEYSGFTLANGDDEVIITDENGVELDRVEYDGGPDFPDPNGASMYLISTDLDNNVAANWAESTVAWENGAGDFGSPGAQNEGNQQPEVPVIIINEIMQNPSAVLDDAGEWFELYNPYDFEVDINGWTVADNDGESFVIDNGDALIIPGDGYLILGNNTDFATNGGVNVAYQYSEFFLSNSSDELVLTDANGNEVDRVEYDGGPNFPDPTGASMFLISPELDNNLAENWAESTIAWDGGAGDFGSPGAMNEEPPAPLGLVINEICQNPAAVGDNNGEWIEIYNPSDTEYDIQGWTIADNDGEAHVIDNLGPLVIQPDGYLVLGINSDTELNGGVPVDYMYTGFNLSNSSDEVVLLDANNVEIDRVEYDDGNTFPDPTGTSMALNSPELDNNLGENWHETMVTWPGSAGDLGTPGFTNIVELFYEIQNPGFESWTVFGVDGPPDDWTNGAPEMMNVIQESEIHMDGDYSACLTPTAEGSYSLYQNIYGVEVAETYEFAGYAYDNVDGLSLNLNLSFYDASNTYISGLSSDPSNDGLEFEMLSVQVEVPELTAYARLNVMATGIPGNVYVDQLSFGQVINVVETDIEQIQTNPEVMDALVSFSGIITQSGNSVHTGYTDVYIQDETGYGVMLYSADPAAGADLMRGDLIDVVGTVSQYFDVTEVIDFTYELVSTGNPLPQAMQFTTNDFNNNALAFEGSYATVTGLLTNDPGEGSFNLYVDDGSGSCVVRINADAGLDFTDIITGVEVTFYGTIDAYQGVPQLQPSTQDDIVTGGQIDEMVLPLQANYFELVSSYLAPDNIDAENVFGGIENLAIVYQNNGHIFVPDLTNTIGDVDFKLGYRIFCRVPSEFSVQGELIDPTQEYQFVSGMWQWLGYPLDYEIPVDMALSEIADDLSIIINDNGEMWIPELNVNDLVNMHPGEGYMIFLNENVNFHYNIPVGREAITDNDLDSRTIPDTETASVATGLPWPIIVGFADSQLKNEISSIGIYDGDLKVGYAIVNEENNFTPVIAWEGAEDYNVDGFVKGHNITLKAFDSAGEEIPVISRENLPLFGEGAFASVTLDLNTEIIPTEFAISSIYPNPFNPSTSINITLPERNNLKVEVYNVLGERVAVLMDGTLSAGTHSINFRADNLASGIFFVKASCAGHSVQMRKVMLVK